VVKHKVSPLFLDFKSIDETMPTFLDLFSHELSQSQSL
jgi:hypothetical protein